ncbi:MAG: hydrolase [Thermoanaerobaculia bacterium]
MRRLDRTKAALAVIDIQERLLPVIDRHDEVAKNAELLIRGAHVLQVPVLLTEQYVKGLGPTVASLKHALEESGGYEPMEKLCFSSYGCAAFETKLRELGRSQVILCGIETHVCVYQTALDLLDAGFAVWVVADAVSSRRAENRTIALERMMQEGVKLASTEMALFELTGVAGTDEFKAISRLVR